MGGKKKKKMTYKIKNKYKEIYCKECGKKTKSYYHQNPLCNDCLIHLKNGNKLNCGVKREK